MCADCLAERESKLRAERERDRLEAWCKGLQEQVLAAEGNTRTAERERDEARAEVARFTGGPKCAGVDWHFKTADALAAAQKRIEGLEAALADTHAARTALETYVWRNCKHNNGEGHQPWVICRACVLAYLRAALSSPAVTAEGKKLGEEGGVTGALAAVVGAFAKEFCDCCGRFYGEDPEQEDCAAQHYAVQQAVKFAPSQPRAAPPKTSEGA